MQTAESVSLGAACIDRSSGKLLWEVTLRELDQPDPVHFLNSWATPTPAIVPGRLFCDFGGWGTWCLDPHEGLGPGQRQEIDRVLKEHADLGDDAFVADHLHRWLA